MTFDEALARWEHLVEILPAIKEEEMALRKALAEGVFENPKEGTNKQAMPDGRTLKLVHKVYRNVDTEVADKLDMSPAKKAKVFRKKYDLRLSEFRKLSKEEQKKLSVAITEKPGSPSLEIIPAPEEVKVG